MLPQITFQTNASSKALKMLMNSVMFSPQKSSPVFPKRPFLTWLLVPVKPIAEVWIPDRDGGSRLGSDSLEAPEEIPPSPMALPVGDHHPRGELLLLPVGVLHLHQTLQPRLPGVLLILVRANLPVLLVSASLPVPPVLASLPVLLVSVSLPVLPVSASLPVLLVSAQSLYQMVSKTKLFIWFFKNYIWMTNVAQELI